MADSKSPPNQKHFSKKLRNVIVVLSVTVLAVVILIAPVIPTQHTVTKTRTRNLRYSSEVYGVYNVPKFVNVTNTDSVSGSFSVTMQWWETIIVRGQSKKELKDTYTQSLFINAKATKSFYLPDNWLILGFWDSFTYSVSAPSTQEAYNVTETEYKSIFDLIQSLRS